MASKESPSNKRSIFDRAEQLGKLLTPLASALAVLAVPVVVAIIANRTQDRSVDKDLVQMAVELLKDTKTDPELREWAVSVINKHSAVPFSSNLIDELSSGRIKLPTPERNTDSPIRVSLEIGSDKFIYCSIEFIESGISTAHVIDANFESGLHAWHEAEIFKNAELKIIRLDGNAACTSEEGSQCEADGTGCKLPCRLGASSRRSNYAALPLPGTFSNGALHLRFKDVSGVSNLHLQYESCLESADQSGKCWGSGLRTESFYIPPAHHRK